jgi:hypothetical protein
MKYLIILIVPILLCGCFGSDPTSIKAGHAAAAQIVSSTAKNEVLLANGLCSALTAEKKAHIQFSTDVAMEYLKQNYTQMTPDEAAEDLLKVFKARDTEMEKLETLVNTYKKALAINQSETAKALGIMGYLSDYSNTGIGSDSMASFNTILQTFITNYVSGTDSITTKEIENNKNISSAVSDLHKKIALKRKAKEVASQIIPEIKKEGKIEPAKEDAGYGTTALIATALSGTGAAGYGAHRYLKNRKKSKKSIKKQKKSKELNKVEEIKND